MAIVFTNTLAAQTGTNTDISLILITDILNQF